MIEVQLHFEPIVWNLPTSDGYMYTRGGNRQQWGFLYIHCSSKFRKEDSTSDAHLFRDTGRRCDAIEFEHNVRSWLGQLFIQDLRILEGRNFTSGELAKQTKNYIYAKTAVFSNNIPFMRRRQHVTIVVILLVMAHWIWSKQRWPSEYLCNLHENPRP